MPIYTCDNVRDSIIRLTGQISDRFYGKGATIGPWQAMTPRGTWPDGQGEEISNIMWERMVASDNGDEWIDKTLSDNAGVDACNLEGETLRFGQTTRTMRVQRRRLKTEHICFEDLRSSFNYENYMGALGRNLKFNTNYVWDSRYRDEYIRLSQHKLTLNDHFDVNDTSTDPTDPPTSKLTWGPLEQIWDVLEAEGAGENGVEMGKSSMSNRPVFDLFTDGTTIRDLIRQDPELREDFRFAYEGSGVNMPLLQARGTTLTYNGYRLVNDSNVRRFDIVGGAKVIRPKYKDAEAATKGVKQEVNPEWLYAEFQTSVVHIPAVFTSLILPTKGGIAGMGFNAVSWMGEFQFLIILDEVCNPYGNKGFFDALFASASEPGLVHLGFTIDHVRCGPSNVGLDCNNNQVPLYT